MSAGYGWVYTASFRECAGCVFGVGGFILCLSGCVMNVSWVLVEVYRVFWGGSGWIFGVNVSLILVPFQCVCQMCLWCCVGAFIWGLPGCVLGVGGGIVGLSG